MSDEQTRIPASQTLNIIRDQDPWPMNLMTAVLSRSASGPPEKPLTEDRLPPDWKGTLAYLQTRLQPREQKIVRQFFQSGMTLSEISIEEKVTAERVRQILERALERLSAGDADEMLTYGIAACMKSASKRRIAIDSKKKLEEACKNGWNDALASSGEEAERARQRMEMERPVTSLGLTARPSNALRRAGIETLGQLLALTWDQLAATANIGASSINQIETRLADAGYTIGERAFPKKVTK